MKLEWWIHLLYQIWCTFYGRTIRLFKFCIFFFYRTVSSVVNSPLIIQGLLSQREDSTDRSLRVVIRERMVWRTRRVYNTFVVWVCLQRVKRSKLTIGDTPILYTLHQGSYYNTITFGSKLTVSPDSHFTYWRFVTLI